MMRARFSPPAREYWPKLTRTRTSKFAGVTRRPLTAVVPRVRVICEPAAPSTAYRDAAPEMTYRPPISALPHPRATTRWNVSWTKTVLAATATPPTFAPASADACPCTSHDPALGCTTAAGCWATGCWAAAEGAATAGSCLFDVAGWLFAAPP